jgi:hypothetical protein
MMNLNIKKTDRYDRFEKHPKNRDLEPEKHKPLQKSMEEDGYKWFFPVICNQQGNRLIVCDGQHRVYFAELYKLPVYYVVAGEDEEINIAKINSTVKNWTIDNFVKMFADQGNQNYVEAYEYMTRHNLRATTAFTIMGDQATPFSISKQIKEGTYRVADRMHALNVGETYMAVAKLKPEMRNVRFIEALHLAYQVKGFKRDRFLRIAKRRTDKLICYTRREHYLDMIEEIYNYGQKVMLSVKVPAMEISRRKRDESRKVAGRTSSATKQKIREAS